MPYIKIDLEFKDYILVGNKLANGCECIGETYDPIRYNSIEFTKSMKKLVNRRWLTNAEYVYINHYKGKRNFSIMFGYQGGEFNHTPSYIEVNIKSLFGWWVKPYEKGVKGYTKFKSRKHIPDEILENYDRQNLSDWVE